MSGLAQTSVSLRSRALQHHAAIVFRGLGLVVIETGADDVVGLFQRRGLRIEAAIDRVVALGAEPEHFSSGMLGDIEARQIARGDDRVIGLVGDAELAQLPLHGVGRARCVGDQDHRTATAAIGVQRFAGLGEGFQPVMDHAPDVAEHDIDAAHEFAQALGEMQRGHDACGRSDAARQRRVACDAR